MFKFLKKIMNNEKLINKNIDSIHRILKTDIRKEPSLQEDEIIFGCGCFWGAENAFGNFRELSQHQLGMLVVRKQPNLLRGMFRDYRPFRGCKSCLG